MPYTDYDVFQDEGAQKYHVLIGKTYPLLSEVINHEGFIGYVFTDGLNEWVTQRTVKFQHPETGIYTDNYMPDYAEIRPAAVRFRKAVTIE